MSENICSNTWGKTKQCYKTKAQAEKARARSRSGLSLHVYHCLYGPHWRLTSQEPRKKSDVVLSAAKIRRKLEANAALIAAAQKRLEESERQINMAKAHQQDELEACAKLIAGWKQ